MPGWTKYCVCFCWSILLTASAQDNEIEYLVRFAGIEDGKTLDRLKENSDLVSLQKSPPRNLFQLQNRVRQDRDTFVKVLRNQGFYDAHVAYEIDGETNPVAIKFDVELNSVYRFNTISVDIVDRVGNLEIVLPPFDALGLKKAAPALAQLVVDAEQSLTSNLREQGFAHVKILGRETVVDRIEKTMDVQYRLRAGPITYFGDTRITGLDRVIERTVRAEIPWSEGDQFKDSLLSRFRERLYDTRLFSVVRIETVVDELEPVALPIDVTLVERKRRTLWSGVEFYTDEGWGTRLGWENRNIQGLGRRLRLETRVGETINEAKGEFRSRHFRRRDQALRLTLEGGRYEPEAFTAKRARSSAIIDRTLTDHLVGSVGLALKISEVEQFDDTESFTLASVPSELTLNRSDSLLDPTHGFVASVRAEPFIHPIKGDNVFLKSSLSLNNYVPLTEQDDFILATRMMIGTIVSDSIDSIPADDRFYAGGGGSIRGYTFQTVGPLMGDEPSGGRSILLGSAELRYRFSERFGAVAFLDAGSAFESVAPDLDEDILLGAGLGLRYFSPIGPIRLDVGVPLDRRDGIDDSFQVYISIGQAF